MTGPDPTPEEVAAAEFDTAITSPTRSPVVDIHADWDRTGNQHPLSDLSQVWEEVTVVRELVGDLPPEVGLVEGRAGSAVSAKIGGRWESPDGAVSTDPVRALAPYDPTAALYGYPTIGTPLTADTGFLTKSGPQTRRLFTGNVTAVTPDTSRDEWSVQVDALDPSNRLRAPITLPAVGMDGIFASRYGPDRYSARTNSQWLVDLILRANGIYASPPPQPGTFISATMHGSSFPEIGGGGVPKQGSYSTPANPDVWAYEGHPHGMMYPRRDAPGPTGLWTSPQVLTMQPGDGFGCSFLCEMPSDPQSPLLFGTILDGGPRPDPTDHFAVLVELINGAPSTIIYTPGGFSYRIIHGHYTRPNKPTWRHIGFHWAFGPPSAGAAPATASVIPGTCTMTMAVDGIKEEPFTVDINIGPVRGNNPWAPSTSIEYYLDVPVTNVCWFSAPLAPDSPLDWSGPNHVSQADIDPGMNEWTGIRQISGEDSWELLTEVAAAEAATVGFSPEGRAYFRSRAKRRELGAPQELTADRELANLVVTTDEASVRNSISATIQPVFVGDYEWVVDSKDPAQFEVGPGATLFPIALPEDTVLVEPWSAYSMNRAAWEVYADQPALRSSLLFCAIAAYMPKNVTISPVAPANSVQVLLYPQGPGHMVVAVYNYNKFTVRFQTENYINTDGTTDFGSAAFRIPGRLLKEAAAQPYNVQDPGSVSLFGPRTFDLGGGSNRWHQHPRAIRGVAESILTTTAHPAPVLGTVTVPHDPRRDLTDPVALVDPSGLGRVRGAVTGITTNLSTSTAVTDELTVRPLVPPGFGLFDDEEMGRVGESLRFGP